MYYLVKKEVMFMNKRIVLCGSMKVKDKILEVKDRLEKKDMKYYYLKNV